MSMMQTMGQHRSEEDKEQQLMDALYAKSRMLPYEQRKGAVDAYLAQEAAAAKAQREHQAKMAELGFNRGTDITKIGLENLGRMEQTRAQIEGQKDITAQSIEGRENVANIMARARAAESEAKRGGMTAAAASSIINNLVMAQKDKDEIQAEYPALVNLVKGQLGSGYTPFGSGDDWGEQLDLGFPAYLK